MSAIPLAAAYPMIPSSLDPLAGLFADPCPEMQEMQPVLQAAAEALLAKTSQEKATELPIYAALKAQEAAYQGRFVLALATAMRECVRRQDYRTRYALGELLTPLLRSTLRLTQSDYVRLLRLYGLDFDVLDYEARRLAFWGFPVGLTLGHVAKLTRQQGVEPALRTYLQQLLDYISTEVKEDTKTRLKIQEILQQEAGPDARPTVLFPDGDAFGRSLNAFVTRQLPAEALTLPWLRLLQLWQQASGTQPSARYRKALDAAAAAVGPEPIRQQTQQWLQELLAVPVEATPHTYDYGTTTYTHTEYLFLLEPSLLTVRGLLWTLQPLVAEAHLRLLAELAVKCYRKIPGKGPLAAGLGNACLGVLAQSGLAGVAYLSRVRPKVKQSNTQALIASHLAKAAQALGVSADQIEDMAVPEFGLHEGQTTWVLAEYTACLSLREGKTQVQWIKAGKTLKAVPAALKATHAAELKEIKDTQALAQQTLMAQRERLDRGLIAARRIPWTWFARYYDQHGLMALLTRPLIWRFFQADGSNVDALWHEQAWCDVQGQPIPAPMESVQVQLWHPVLSAPAEVVAWRAVLEARQLRQPLKQAYRELYLLTPPEETTRTYSNRMAAHLLRQHQFNSLAKLRGWRYSLLGAYDKGYESDMAELDVPGQGLQAQFWVSEVSADNAWNEAGIWHYVSTDQVRFVTDQGPVPLPDVPPLIFSEVMRDVDLFVGVASVGNDPQWRDNGGLPAYRNYWDNYSFGELSEVAKTRRLALERLVPRLKIGRVSELQDRFLVVKGKRRTYKIHIGSGNILMEPNDQYLCIVPDRSAKSLGAPDVFLPFEGDAVLSIILSKALLLIDDDQITDSTILRQLNG